MVLFDQIDESKSTLIRGASDGLGGARVEPKIH